MTTIAFKDGIICADSGITCNEMSITDDIPKIRRNKAGDLAGAAGSRGYCHKFLEWFSAGEIGDTIEASEDACAVIIRADGSIYVLDGGGRFRMSRPNVAIGTGAPFAYAIMQSGGSAEEAVKIACELDIYSAGPVVSLSRG